jgi:cysteine sulfinate desulfinase/cysteine desulfurase-like protein
LMYMRKRARITPYFHGGAQERNRRAGTLNVPGIVGMAKALDLCRERMTEDAVREAELRDRLWKGLSENIGALYLNGSMEHRLANNLNVRLDGIEGESMILMLDMEGICVSSGSGTKHHRRTRRPFHQGVPADRLPTPRDVANMVRQLRSLQTEGHVICTQNW